MQRPVQKKTSASLVPILLLLFGALLIVFAAAWALTRGQADGAATPTRNANLPYPEIDRVTLADAKKAFDGGGALFVDARSMEQFNASHIPGAVSVPYDNVAAASANLDKNRWIITYCT